MKPKKIYLSNSEIETFKHRTENGKWDHVLISVEALKEWIEENKQRDRLKTMDMIDADELLKFIDDGKQE